MGGRGGGGGGRTDETVEQTETGEEREGQTVRHIERERQWDSSELRTLLHKD